ncbi:MAG TPA: C40 family peptidase, partial [Anditalea sp.]|nr:C40 family peptidase [Anditalea sp.]
MDRAFNRLHHRFEPMHKKANKQYKNALKYAINLFNFSVAVVLIIIMAQNFSQAQKLGTGPSYVAGFSYIDTLNTDSKVDSLIDYALSLEGIPYIWGGKTLKGFDCSGFIYHVYNKFEIEVPGGSANQYQLGEPIAEKDIQKGDLLFFTGTDRRSKRVGHVGFVISTADGIQFAHSSSGGGGKGVTVNDLDHPGYRM